MPYDCMPKREMPFDRMPKYRRVKINLVQGSLLGLILTHEGAIKAISCIDFKYFKIHNEGGNAELCVTAFINKS